MSVYETLGFVGTVFFFCVGFFVCFAMALVGSLVTYQLLVKGGDRTLEGLKIVSHLPFRADPSFIDELKNVSRTDNVTRTPATIHPIQHF